MSCISGTSNAFSMIDLRGIEFQQGKPTPESVLEQAVKVPVESSLLILKEGADTVLRHPELKIQILGFTDDQECIGADQCRDLSRRRATLVYEWLLKHGVPSSQVAGIEGVGDQPIDFNDYEEGRQRNRRVELRVTEFDKP
jgi:OOP family OmpA-OmpF porin